MSTPTCHFLPDFQNSRQQQDYDGQYYRANRTKYPPAYCECYDRADS